MKLTLLDNHVRAEGDAKSLKQLAEYLSYNNDIRAFEKRHVGIEFDWSNEEHLREVGEKTYFEFFQNYLCHKISGKMLNWYQPNPNDPTEMGKPFQPWAMSDGYTSVVSIFQGNKAKFRSGLLGHAINFFQDEGVEVEVIDARSDYPKLTVEPVYSVGKFTAREDQRKIIDSFRQSLLDTENYGHFFTSILLKLAVNTGKTIIAGLLVANLKNPRILMPHRERYLCARAVADYMEMGFEVGVIAADKKEVKTILKERGIDTEPIWGIAPFTVVMVQTVQARLKKGDITVKDLEYFNLLLADECEQLVGDQTTALIDKCRMPMKLGYSGTPLDSDDGYNRLTVLGLFGSQIYEVTTKDNIENSVSQKPIVNFSLNEMVGVKGLSISKAKYHIYTDPERLDIFMDRMLYHLGEGRTQWIVYYGDAELVFGVWLENELRKRLGLLAVIAHVNGKIKNRAEIFGQYLAGEVNVLIANSVIKRGVNLPNIRVFFQWESNDNDISVQQAAIGRGTRRDGQNEEFYIEDIYDKGNPELEAASRYRMNIYAHDSHGAEINYLYPNKDGIPT